MANTNLENEDLILKDISNGNPDAFRILYLYYYDRLFQFAMMFLGSDSASEDVVEDVFFILWRDRSTLPSIINFQSYIYQSVKNGCLNVLKSGYISKRDYTLITDLQLTSSTESPLDVLTHQELNKAIQKAVNQLPDRCKIIFKMAKEDELSHKQIAEILNVKASTVARQILLAKDKIRQSLVVFLK